MSPPKGALPGIDGPDGNKAQPATAGLGQRGLLPRALEKRFDAMANQLERSDIHHRNKTLLFLPPAPERSSDFRLAPGGAGFHE
jgi:hypothetical protein